MKWVFVVFILLIQQIICESATEDTVLTWSDTTTEEPLELTTLFALDFNSTTSFDPDVNSTIPFEPDINSATSFDPDFNLTTSFAANFDSATSLEPDLNTAPSFDPDLNPTTGTIDTLIAKSGASPLVTHVLRKIFRTYEPYCWRHSHGRGVGRPFHACPDHSPDQSGLFCYPSCRDGYAGVGPMCWEKCQNLTATGFACWDIRVSKRSCPWYNKCGILHSSCVSCPANYTKLGCVCGRVHMRSSYGRGVGSSLICSKSYEQNGALCYEKCGKGYNGVGPVCWQECPSTHPSSCLAGCAITKEMCQQKVKDMVKSVIGSSITILNTVIGIPLISSKIFDILSKAAKSDWKAVANDMLTVAQLLAQKILPKMARNFLHKSFGSIESATNNASLILTATAMKDKNLLSSFLQFFRLDSIDIAFNHGKCEVSGTDDFEFL